MTNSVVRYLLLNQGPLPRDTRYGGVCVCGWGVVVVWGWEGGGCGGDDCFLILWVRLDKSLIADLPDVFVCNSAL